MYQPSNYQPSNYQQPTYQPSNYQPPAYPGTQQPGLRCLLCGRIAAPMPRGVRTCVYCSAPLPVQRWRADPPFPAATSTRRHPNRSRTYAGPPSYRGNPGWGFPPVVWRAAKPAESADDELAPSRLIRASQYLCALTFLTALTAAAAEAWRYMLLLRGRTEVLSGPAVAASDRLVSVAASAATLCALVTAVVVLPTLVRLHGVAARRAGLAPGRPPASVLARLVVPGWNVYGFPLIAGEVDSLLAPVENGRRPRLSRLVVALWWLWVADAALVLLTLGRAFGRSEQSMADTVELHMLVDLVAAGVALLCALLFRRFRRRLVGDRAGELGGWVVRPPAPTRGTGRTAGGGPAGPALPAGAGQPATVKMARGSAADGPVASQPTVSASASGDQPAAAAEPDPTTVTPTR